MPSLPKHIERADGNSSDDQSRLGSTLKVRKSLKNLREQFRSPEKTVPSQSQTAPPWGKSKSFPAMPYRPGSPSFQSKSYLMNPRSPPSPPKHAGPVSRHHEGKGSRYEQSIYTDHGPNSSTDLTRWQSDQPTASSAWPSDSDTFTGSQPESSTGKVLQGSVEPSSRFSLDSEDGPSTFRKLSSKVSSEVKKGSRSLLGKVFPKGSK